MSPQLISRLVPRFSAASSASPQAPARLPGSYGKLPISFEPNQGQTGKPVQFVARGSGYMLFLEPVGRHLVSLCTNIACLLDGAYELLEHAEDTLGIKTGVTTDDGEFTLEEVECLALCDKAPCVQINYRFFESVTPQAFDQLVDDARAGQLAADVPQHGVMIRNGAPGTSWQSAGD